MAEPEGASVDDEARWDPQEIEQGRNVSARALFQLVDVRHSSPPGHRTAIASSTQTEHMLLAAFAAEAAMVTTPTPMETRLKRAKQANSWQSRLDKALLDVDAGPQARIRLLQRALKDSALQEDVKLAAEEIREKGMGKGHVLALDLLFPTGTTARADLEGLMALRKQVPELLAAQRQQPPPTRAQLQELLASAPPPDPLLGFKIAGELAGLATDQAKRQV